MSDIRLMTLTNRRNNPGPDGTPSIYQASLNVLNGPHSLARHEINKTFTRSIHHDENQGKTFIDYVNVDNQKILTVHIVGEVGSESQGTWLGAYPKNLPAHKLPLNDNSNAHRMVIAARCPTGAPLDLQSAWKGGMGAIEEVLFEDKDAADAAREKPSNRNVHEAEGPRERNRPSTSIFQMDADMQAVTPARKIGDTYDPDMFSEHRGDFFDHSPSIKVVQRDYQNVEKSLIAPFELKNVLTEGTFFSAQVTLHTYIFYGNEVPNKVHHIYVDKLRVLDKGYGAAWQIPIPSFPVAGPSGPSTPSPKKRKERDDAADDAFGAFDTVTPKKKF
ncbi:hypothetical protein MVEN_01952600 [Mycena venus]|uniref:Uncharacterized protein n=1 Tax=Mycena venus TaxID=2733690 RepID=A0A8H6XGK9_9AGAR|nr:hypothetical protein MVEN_01952600 [Mycena venus]